MGQKMLNVARERYKEGIMTFRGRKYFQRAGGPVIREDFTRV